MNRRRVALGLIGGTLVVLVGLFGGSVGRLVPADAAVDAAGNDYFVVAVAAGVGVLLAVALALSGRPGNVEVATTPDPERAVSLPVPGDEFDAAMTSRTALLPVVGSADRRALRGRLRTAAVDRLMRTENYSRGEAERRIARGTWSDDPVARLFLAENPPLGVRVGAVARSWLRLRPWPQTGARRTARALVAASDEVTYP